MSGSLARAAPVRFLVGVTLVWTIGRGIALAGWRPDAARHAPTAISGRVHPLPTPPVVGRYRVAAFARPSFPLTLPPKITRPFDRVTMSQAIVAKRAIASLLRASSARGVATPTLMLAAFHPIAMPGYRFANGFVDAKAVIGPERSASRLAGSAWAFVRGGGRATNLSPVGQIGGGQAGARLLYTVDRPDRIALAARVSRTIGGIDQTEAAVGLDWKPIARLPVHLMLDRRIAIDSGGRNAWALGAAGGVDDVRVARGWRLDGYGEAGVVGAHRRDLYADGAARIARAIDLGGGRSLGLGGGAWGAAQPRAARLDVGPSAVLRAPVAGRFVAVALDWRERIVGDAKPGSGVALTLATSF